jgi:predicted PolB exonuclease-like 3'-5' exonuclease
MTKEELKKVLHSRPGYLKSGSKTLSKLFNIQRRFAKEAVREVKIEMEHPVTPFKRLFFDIETSPNIGWFWSASWKTSIGTHQITKERRVICVSYKWEHEKKVHHLVWDKDKDDKQLLEDFSKIIAQADEVIAHNGDRFDIPWLRTRCIMHGIPFPTYIKSLDTLKKVKSMFNFQSNRLDYVAEALGLGNKINIEPEVWQRVVFNAVGDSGYKAAIQEMLEYCDYDVVLLEDVFHKIQSYIKPVSHVGIAQGKERHTCPMCGSEETDYIGHTVTSTGIVKRHMECEDCETDYVIPNRVFLKMFE